jgi:hypothetical protein
VETLLTGKFKGTRSLVGLETLYSTVSDWGIKREQGLETLKGGESGVENLGVI